MCGRDLNPLGIVYGALAALGLATVSAVSHRVIRAGEPRQTTLYVALGAAATFVVLTLAGGAFTLPDTRAGWWGFVGTNLFYAVAMIGFFAAISLIGPARTDRTSPRLNSRH